MAKTEKGHGNGVIVTN